MPSLELIGHQSQCVRISECMFVYIYVCMLLYISLSLVDCGNGYYSCLKSHCPVISYLTFDIIH